MEELKNKIIKKFYMIVELMNEESLNALKLEVDKLYLITKIFVETEEGEQDD